MIKHTSLGHKGGWYHFRIHKFKAESLCTNSLGSLREYLDKVFRECPNDYFWKGPRSSGLKFRLENLNLKDIKNHEICMLTKLGLDMNKDRYQTGHSRVQVFMLENDKCTIATEVPIWLTSNEEGYKFNDKEPLTGHIDILRIEDGKIWVWDYKPSANQEVFAATQIYFYALMLSKRINIPLDKFRCGYFDSNNCYMFNPVNCKLPKFKEISEFY
jgi:hypothetical protein